MYGQQSRNQTNWLLVCTVCLPIHTISVLLLCTSMCQNNRVWSRKWILLTATTTPITSSFLWVLLFNLSCSSILAALPLLFTVLSLLCVCDTLFLRCLYTMRVSITGVAATMHRVLQQCVKWHPSLAGPHLTTQQLSQRISSQPATLQEPLSKRCLL